LYIRSDKWSFVFEGNVLVVKNFITSEVNIVGMTNFATDLADVSDVSSLLKESAVATEINNVRIWRCPYYGNSKPEGTA